MASNASPSPLPAWIAAYEHDLYTWVRARLGRDLQRLCDPEDVLQEVWIRAAGCLPQETIQFPRAWLFGIACNVLREELRSTRRDADHVRTPGDTALATLMPVATSVTRQVARRERRAAFYAEIDQLDEADRELLVMHLLEQRPLAEVAVRLQIKVAAASKRVQRLRARLARHGPLVRFLKWWE